MAKEVAEEYASSLADLTVNSKPLINMLTILAEENIDHAGVIVETVEKHLEKVHPDIKLPVLYLVDSIIKNVGGAYTQKFSQSIVNMFTRTFKQVDEKVRSQMFKLRETWHDVFPATKLYQLDVKVNLIDPAWPIQAQPQQSNIHVNPNFLKKTAPTTSATPVLTEEEEKMRNILAKKEQELLMLQRKKIEMELEQTKRQLEFAEKNAKKIVPPVMGVNAPTTMPVAMVNPVVAPVVSTIPAISVEVAPPVNLPVKQRLGPPVNKVGGRIAPVSAALASARRDPRLARGGAPPTAPVLSQPIASNVFDIKPLERVIKRKNVITIDVRPDGPPPRDPRRRDPRLNKRDDRPRRQPRPRPEEQPELPIPPPDRLPEIKDITKLPPIPKIRREREPDEEQPVVPKKKKDVRDDRKKKREKDSGSANSSPEKKNRSQKDREVKEKEKEAPKEIKEKEKEAPKEQRDKRRRERRLEPEPEAPAPEPEEVPFKELKNYRKDRYMRRNREKSDSPERPAPSDDKPDDKPAADAPNVGDVVMENKDVDLRVLHPVVAETKAAPVAQKRSSTELLEGKPKKTKIDKFDVLFGNEDVDLRQLPQVEELAAPPPPSLLESPKRDAVPKEEEYEPSPRKSPKKDWNDVKEKTEDTKKTPSKLDLVRAKLAEATKGKDRLGRPLLFSKSPSIERERRRTLSTEDTDLRVENGDEFDAADHKKSISIIMSQAKEQFTDGQLDKNQYNTLMYQVLQLNEKLKLKEAKQRESLEVSKRKLKAHTQEENHKVASPKSSPNTFGDIDERITPAAFLDTPPDSQNYMGTDSDMRINSMPPLDAIDAPNHGILPMPPAMPPMFGPFPPAWRGPRPRTEEYVPRRFRAPVPPFFRGKFDKRVGVWPPFEPRPALPPLPTPKIGTCQGICPLQPYERTASPPPLGLTSVVIPPTDFKVLEYIDQDPFKTIQIDGIPRDIRYYGDTAVIMMDWDDPREIKFLPGSRRVTFDNKDSIVLSFNECYKKVEIDDQVFDIKFGAPTRELYINGRWFECFFGGQPLGVIIDGKPRLVHLEGPLPQVDIGKTKRTDLVAGKINLIVNAVHICPVYLDAKVQKFQIENQFFTIRFVDSFRTVLINEQPFKVEFGDLPRPIQVGDMKYFIRFSALPRHVKPGLTKVVNMEGSMLMLPLEPIVSFENIHDQNSMEMGVEVPPRPPKTPSPEATPEKGLDMLASLMPSSMAPASASEYSSAEPLFTKPDKIPGLETAEEKPANPVLPVLGNINVTDLFAKLVASGIVQVPKEPKTEEKPEPKTEEVKPKPKEDKTVIHSVDLLKPETLRVKQPGLVAKLYGGMQCSGCGTRFPPEHTVRYSQHLDWHFRQNRRDRDSARRAHSRHWHYDLSDWLQYEEVEDLEEREKSWFETGGAEEGGAIVSAVLPGEGEEAPSVAAGAPAAHHCTLCGDAFQQFYNEDKEEWHLRNSVRHEDKNYHPLCFDDYKLSLTKNETPPEETTDDVLSVDKVEEAIEIKDVDDDTNSQSDNESVVEVVEPVPEELEPVEIDEGDEDDVIYKAEPVEEVLVEDDADTDDETAATRAERDRLAQIDFSKVKVKQEPVDPDDEPVITAEEASPPPTVDTTVTTVQSSLDGNTQLEVPTVRVQPTAIRINISKTVPTLPEPTMEDETDEPPPPGEEPELEYTLKPSLEGIRLSRQPPIQKGSELSGLCSIM
ncbi:unnamed protein product [Chilo suppressalis]|uniref:CID domain-containing protein n=1 Tax=Chilo suppressalis TaxID=168631 RepID=A0ABN8AQ51_CHISP|nr:unnamed protein product [Chilo suppressalis]